MADKRLSKRRVKNGRTVWSACLPLPRGADGVRRRHRFSFIGNKKNAEKALNTAIESINKRSFVAPDRMTIGQYVPHWLKVSKPDYAGKTWERFEGITRVHVIPKLGDVVLHI